MDDPDIAELAVRARKLGVSERVDLRGHVPYERIPQILSSASVALLPLPDEPVARLFTSPLKLFDYMAAGVPIVASDLPALREVLRHEENALLARAGDPDAFADAVGRLLADPVLAGRIGRQAQLDVRQYGWDSRARAILNAIGDRPRRRRDLLPNMSTVAR
jgi:glycosyltransferase involved in cell wall biosynthesis